MNFVRLGGVVTMVALATLASVCGCRRGGTRRRLRSDRPRRRVSFRNTLFSKTTACTASRSFPSKRRRRPRRRLVADVLDDRLRQRWAAGGDAVDLFLDPLSPPAGRREPPPPTHDRCRCWNGSGRWRRWACSSSCSSGERSIYVRAYRAPDDATTVYVVAKQWMWKFQHPEGQREINTLHVPVGRPIKLAADLRRRDPQFLRAGVSRAHGRAARSLHVRLVPGHEAGHVPPVLLAVLRHEPRQDDRHGRRHGTGRLPAAGSQSSGRGLAGALQGRKIFLEVSLPELP